MNIQALSYINLSDIIDQYSELNKIEWTDSYFKVVNISYGAVDFNLISMSTFVTILAELYEEESLSEECYLTLSNDFDVLTNVYVNLEA
jgi:hypothetical protein